MLGRGHHRHGSRRPRPSGARLSVVLTDPTVNGCRPGDTTCPDDHRGRIAGRRRHGRRARFTGPSSPAAQPGLDERPPIPAGKTAGTGTSSQAAVRTSIETSDTNDTRLKPCLNGPGPRRYGHLHAVSAHPRSEDQRHADDQEPVSRIQRSQLDHEDLPSAHRAVRITFLAIPPRADLAPDARPGGVTHRDQSLRNATRGLQIAAWLPTMATRWRRRARPTTAKTKAFTVN